MKLSVLVCTIPERFDKFNALLRKLNLLSFNLGVEILHDNSPKGTKTIGGKRNDLLNKAVGEYVCFVDDDDDISDDYFTEILKAIESKPDCVGFEIACNMEGKKVNFSLKHLGKNYYGFELTEKSQGIYFLRLSIDGKQLVEKIVVVD